MTDTTDLIQRLHTAWTYCGVEQALRFEAAAALEQQAAQIEALRADAERLIHERDHERAHREAAANMLVRIHALLNPPPVVADGSVYRFDNPNANDVLQLLSDRVRDVPHYLAVIDAALRQEQPAGAQEGPKP